MRSKTFVFLFFLATIVLNATTDSGTYIFFSGDLDSSSTTSGDGFVITVDDDDDDDDDPYWLAVWDYSSMTLEEDLSSVSYDTDTDTYTVEMIYSTTSTTGNVFANYIQQEDSTTEVLTYQSASLSVINSTFLNTVSDTLYTRVHWKGTADGDGSIDVSSGEAVYDVTINSYTVDSYAIDFYLPSSTASQAYTYEINQLSDEVLALSSGALDTSLENAILDALDALEDSDSVGSDYLEAMFDAMIGELEDDVAEAAAAFFLSDKDDFLTDLQEVIDLLNSITFNDSTFFDLAIEDTTDYEVLTGDIGDYVMTFNFNTFSVNVTSDGVTSTISNEVTNADNLDFLEEAVKYALIEPVDISPFTADYSLDSSDFESLVDILNVSIDEEYDGYETAGTFYIDLESDDSDEITISGEITDPTLVDETSSSALLTDPDVVVLDADAEWYYTWMGSVNFTNAPWLYSHMGWFYEGEEGENANGWYYSLHDTLGGWFYSDKDGSNEVGFWIYAVGSEDSVLVSDWYFILK